MQCFQRKVLFVFLSTLFYVNGGISGSDESLNYDHLSIKEACPILEKQLKSAKATVIKDEAFRDYLISIDVVIAPDEPAFLFLNNIPLRDDLIKIYHDSSVVFELSKLHAEQLFLNKLPHSKNINPLLRKNSCCLKNFMGKFCVDNKHYQCPKNQKYRSIDGYCTSSYRPKEGAAGTPYVSLLNQNYGDSISTIRKEKRTRNRLPHSRVLSNIFLDRCQNNDIFLEDGPSFAGAQFGGVLALDTVALAYLRGNPSVTCCTKDYSTVLPKELLHRSCDPIKIPKDDKFFGPRGMTCMNFLRGQPGYDNDCVLSSREQINIVTSSIDLSFIYGPVKELADAARSFEDGLLSTNSDNLFPEDANGNFIYTDFRTVATPVVSVFVLIFIREHNRIAQVLKNKFPNWNDEKLFQEARRWNIAQFQHLMFEWYEIFIPEQYKHLRITKSKETNVTVSTSNEFGHGALRHHHQFIQETIGLFDQNGNLIEESLLGDSDSSALIRNSYSKLARSLFYQKINYNGCHNQIRNQLFKSPDGVGIDLFSFDVKRGRDFGLQPYYKYVHLCLNKRVESFSDLEFLISDKDIIQLRKVYDSVYDIDLYIGIHLEKRQKKFQFGPVGSCIINEQFYRYRHGDSFFYNNPKQNHPFTDAQLTEIQKVSFSRILCNNGDIKKVTKNAFWAESGLNPVVNCISVPVVNIVY